MTLNQAIRRIKALAEAHSQVRTFARGLITDFLTDKTTAYPAIFLQNAGGNISIRNKECALKFRMFFVDLVHVSEDSKENETDVQSDMISIAMDLLTQMNNGNYNDWKVSQDNSLQLIVESGDDMYAGCYIDFTISFLYKQNVCEIPTTKTNYQTAD